MSIMMLSYIASRYRRRTRAGARPRQLQANCTFQVLHAYVTVRPLPHILRHPSYLACEGCTGHSTSACMLQLLPRWRPVQPSPVARAHAPGAPRRPRQHRCRLPHLRCRAPRLPPLMLPLLHPPPLLPLPRSCIPPTLTSYMTSRTPLWPPYPRRTMKQGQPPRGGAPTPGSLGHSAVTCSPCPLVSRGPPRPGPGAETITSRTRVTHPLASANVTAAVKKDGGAAAAAETWKWRQVRPHGTCACSFIPLSHETIGRVGPWVRGSGRARIPCSDRGSCCQGCSSCCNLGSPQYCGDPGVYADTVYTCATCRFLPCPRLTYRWQSV